MSDHIHKRHNKSLLLYHLVCPIKYRRSVLSEAVEKSLVEVCKRIESRFEINFVEIGADENHVHFLIQSVPMLSVKTIVQTVKSITAKELFRLHPEVKNQLWGGQFWTSGYYVNTVGQYANEGVIEDDWLLGIACDFAPCSTAAVATCLVEAACGNIHEHD